MHIIWPLFCFFDADCSAKTSPPRRGCSAARRLKLQDGLTSLWQSQKRELFEAEYNLSHGDIKLARPQTSFLFSSPTVTHDLVDSLLALRPHPTCTLTKAELPSNNIKSTTHNYNNIHNHKMSIPDPTSNYEEVEGVDVAVFRAYEAWSLEESSEETGEDDIYGIGFGVPRECMSSSVRVTLGNRLTSTATTATKEQQKPLSPLPSPAQRRRSSVACLGPARLTSLLPPTNFGAVLPRAVYRSQFPLPENFGFIKTLKLKTILTLVPEPYPQPYVSFLQENGIHQIRVHVPANKETVKIEATTMVQALGVVLDRTNYPLLIHCNKGKHRTGCVVASFRKVLGDSMDSIINEYHTYAGRKARELDQQFIREFDERALIWMAREHGFLEDEPSSESPAALSLLPASRLRG
jgi:tyrosine-protein phosphatase SIW14